jgi:hypothetical protein
MPRAILFFILTLTPLCAQENWTYLDNGHVRLGVNMNAGACVGWFSHSKSGKNLLNSYDEGRYLQQSYYGDKDGSDWNGTPWRFNPVQGGSWKGQKAVVLEQKIDKDSIYTKTRPRHWATGAEVNDVTMEQWLSLDGGLARLRFKMTYAGATVHKPAHQELPALFVQPEYDTLVFCEAAQPAWQNAPLTKKQPGYPNETVKFSEPWCAWVDQTGQGIGMFFPHAHEATCYRFRGGGKSNCSYIAPIQTFSLRPALVFEYHITLALGTPDQIRSTFQKLQPLPSKAQN